MVNRLCEKPTWVRRIKKKKVAETGEDLEELVEVEDLTNVNYDQLVAKSNLSDGEMEKLTRLICD